MTNLERFFERIGLPSDTKIEKNVEFLSLVQSQCVKRIAYENLDILAGVPVELSKEAVFDKIVLRGRGGYCFELNGLLFHMLGEMGFRVSERFARFLRGESEIPMRRHRVTVVSMEDGDYLMDIGVGQIAPRQPLKIEEGLVQEQNGETYCFRRDDVHGWVLSDLSHGQWRDYICFADAPAFEIDFLQPSFFCEKHPDSVFNKRMMIAIKTDGGRKTLDDHTYKVFVGETLVQIEENVSEERVRELLEREFLLKNFFAGSAV